MKTNRYWEESIEAALEEANLVATQEQIETMAQVVEVSHDNYGMAHGYDCIPNPLSEENKRLEKLLKEEREKVVCKECGGSGRIISQGPYHSSNSQCDWCRGEGYVPRLKGQRYH